MLDFIVYSHSSYKKILEIQTDYLKGKGNLILFINQNQEDFDSIYLNYSKIVFYDDSDQYAKRLINCLSQIELNYFIFIHDIDILITFDEVILKKFFNLMVDKKIDRIDLKYTENNYSELNIELDFGKKINLVLQKDINNFIYNVNPSIWDKKTFLKILNQFPYKTYRDIENRDVQGFVEQFNVYKVNSENKLLCGYFECVDFFKFLHISHSGRILIYNKQFVTEYNQSYIDAKDDFEHIISKYKL